jgi:RimJ/RimL family protein N-acetyltransferase
MTVFIPGEVIKVFTDKKGEEVILRLPEWTDLDELLEYINELSKEQTFINFCGEEITRDQEIEYLKGVLEKSEKRQGVYLVVEAKGKIVGTSAVEQNLTDINRGKHIGKFGISLKKDYRERGIGKVLAQTAITEAKERIPGLRLIILDVFEPNQIGQDLYRKLGFVQFGRLPAGIWHIDKYVDKIKMYLKVGGE